MSRKWRHDQMYALQKQIWSDVDDHPPGEYTHYSGPRGILGILKSKEIWFSNLTQQSDLREISYQDPTSYFGLGDLWHAHICCFCLTGDGKSMRDSYADHGRGGRSS